MDNIDKNLLNEIQSGFPVTPQPFLELGKRLDISESEVIDRIKKLKKEGVIRRMSLNQHNRVAPMKKSETVMHH